MHLEPSDLLAGTRVFPHPERPSRLYAELSPAWNILYVFGGVTMACAMSAARARLSQASFQPLTATATYLAPVKAGRVELEVRTLRRGKGSEQIAVELFEQNGEQPALHLMTTFGPERESDSFTDLRFPNVPAPEQIAPHVPRAGSPMLMVPYYHNVETRVAKPLEPSSQEGRARWYGWHRFRKTPRLPDGTLDPLAYVPACDMIGPALRVARGPGAPMQMVVSLEISLHFFARTRSEWLLQDAHIYHLADGYVSGVVHLWDEQQRLVGHALQRALVRPQAF